MQHENKTFREEIETLKRHLASMTIPIHHHRERYLNPNPTELKTHMPNRCPGCGNTTLKEESVMMIDITDIPKPIKATTTRHHLVTCRCDECGMDKMEPIVDIPKQGSYGKNVIITVVSNFLDRLPGRLNAANMGRHGISISAGSIHNILSRMGSSLSEPTLQIQNQVRKARVPHIDETSISLNDKRSGYSLTRRPVTSTMPYAPVEVPMLSMRF